MSRPGPKLLIVGDSISLGITEAFGSKVLARLPSAFPDHLGPMLPGWEIVVDAAPNRTTTQALPLLPDLLKAHQPDLALLMLGGNDGDLDWRRFIMTQGAQSRSATSLERFGENLQQLVSLVAGAGAIAALADLPSCDIQRRATWISSKVKQDVNAMVEAAGGQAEADRRVRSYVDAIESVATRNNVAVVRWGERVNALPPERAFGPDFMHPGAESQKIIAEEVVAIAGMLMRAAAMAKRSTVGA